MLIAETNKWLYTREEQVDSCELLEFTFFQTRPLESKKNIIAGAFPGTGVDWEISDVIFDEGAMLSKEVYKTTAQVIHLPHSIAEFVMDSEGIFDKLFDRVLSISSGQNDINFSAHPVFSSSVRLTGPSEDAIRELFTPELIQFLESEEVYHIECNGDALIIFKSLRTAKTGEIKNMVRFSEELVTILI